MSAEIPRQVMVRALVACIHQVLSDLGYPGSTLQVSGSDFKDRVYIDRINRWARVRVDDLRLTVLDITDSAKPYVITKALERVIDYHNAKRCGSLPRS